MEFLGGQQGKDLALSLLWLWLPLWCVFDPWPRNFCISLARPKKIQCSEFLPMSETVSAKAYD